MIDSPVLCVSSGMLAPKKADTPLGRLHQYLNYGLLGLATILNERGYAVSVHHGGFEDPAVFAHRLYEHGQLNTSSPILLSLPSSFSIPWARAFAETVKRHEPASKIVVGGRWVTATDGAWIRRQIPSADLVVFGMAESRIGDILNPALWPRVSGTDAYLLGKGVSDDGRPTALDFRLVDGFKEFQPCVEVSRGCGMGCNFCAEAEVALSDTQDPVIVADALRTMLELYAGPVRPYFQASFFRPSSVWIDLLKQQILRNAVRVAWRAESRVDGLAPTQIANLAECGLRVLDLGLESASPTQLRRMNKTPNPEAYLRRAAALLEACAESGVWTKVNVLLFPGESTATLEETRSWLQLHRTAIKGLSVGPMIVFRYGEQSLQYLDRVRTFGASPVHASDLDDQGYAHLHLSPEIDHAAAVEYSLQLSREFMTANDYFDLKSFSYFPRSLTREKFDGIVSSMDRSQLPFVL